MSLSPSWGKSCVSWGLKYPSLQWCPKSRQWGWAIIPNQAATECVMSLRWDINLGNTLIAGGGVPTRVLRCECSAGHTPAAGDQVSVFSSARLGCYVRASRPGLSARVLIPHSAGGWKSQITVPAWSGQNRACHCDLTRQKGRGCSLGLSPHYQDGIHLTTFQHHYLRG